jgi:hypothetical protein
MEFNVHLDEHPLYMYICILQMYSNVRTVAGIALVTVGNGHGQGLPSS